MGHCQLQRNLPEKALKMFQKALAIYEDLGDQTKCANTHLMISAIYQQEQGFEHALKAAEDANNIFLGLNEYESAGRALLKVASIHLEVDGHETAGTLVKEAIEYFKQVDDIEGDMDLSNLTGQKAAKLFLVIQDKTGQLNALLVSTNAAITSISNMGYGEENFHKRHFVDALNAARRNAREAMEIARKLQVDSLLGISLSLQSQVLLIEGHTEEACANIKEAINIFRHIGDALNEAVALTVSVPILASHGDVEKATANAMKAISMQKELGNKSGEQRAREALENVQPTKLKAAPVLKTDSTIEDTTVTTEGGITAEAMVAKIQEVTMKILNLEDDVIEPDTPLMQAGITSGTSVMLRNEIAAQIPGVDIPFTLMFDYPSINAITGFLMSQ